MNISLVFGYIGLLFGIIYKIPQIRKIYKNKKATDISKKTFTMHNLSYVSLIIYILTSKSIDYLILLYYTIGLIQNIAILCMKSYYKKNITTNT